MPSDRPFILVTGSSGLIGSALCQRLRETYTVIGLDRADPPHPQEQVTTFPIDLGSSDSVDEACSRAAHRCGNHLAAVIHLANHCDFSGEPDGRYEQINVRGTTRLLRALRGVSIDQFVYGSTVLVHAPTRPGMPLREDSPLRPSWDYPRSKLEAETLLRDGRGDTPLAVLRFAGVYDARCRALPLAHQIQRIHERTVTSRVFPGDTGHGHAYVHLDDVVSAICLTLGRRDRLPAETALLIGEPETVSYGDLQRAIARILHGEEWETRQISKVMAKVGAWMQENLPLGDDPFIKPWMVELADHHYELDITRARTLLGWEPAQRLRRVLPRMLQRLVDDPGGWYHDNRLMLPLHALLGH